MALTDVATSHGDFSYVWWYSVTKSDSDLQQLHTALWAVARGWHVLPMHAEGKVPAWSDWESRATTDLDELRRWWQVHPLANVGIACGPSELLVVDLDTVKGTPRPWAGTIVRHGRESLALLATAAGEPDPIDTYSVLTPHGEHRYFLAPVDRKLRGTIGSLGPGIDTRAWGSAVVANGSRLRTSGQTLHYRQHLQRPDDPAPLPRWLLEMLSPSAAPSSSPVLEPVRITAGPRLAGYVAAAVRREAEAVALARPGTRASTTFRSAAALGGLVGAGVLREVDAADALLRAATVHDGIGNWTSHEARRHIANGLNRGKHTPRRITLQS